MSTPTIPALPSFAERAASLPQNPVPAPQFTPPNTPNAPSGGANSPPAPAMPGGLGLPPQTPAPTPQPTLIQRYEQEGRIPVGRFKSEQELVDALYQVAETAAARLDQAQQPAPVTPQAPATPAAPAVPSEDLTKMATYFQQQNWLALQNGQWVANNPLATQLAGQLNQQIVEAQARQAELADPVSFFNKYGSQAIKTNLDPLEQKLAALEQQYQTLQQQMFESAPKPWDGFMKQNEAQLWTTDPAGQRTPSAVGKVYHDAFEMARQYGMSPADIHKFAETATKPYLQQTQQAPAQPQQSWMQQVTAHQAPTDPSFNRPGTVLNNGVPPGQMGVPRENNGMTSFQLLAQMPQ